VLRNAELAREQAAADSYIDRLRPGVIDATAVSLFTEGYCVQLAQALTDITGWDVIAPIDGTGEAVHFGVQWGTKDYAIDIRGLQRRQHWMTRWGGIGVVSFGPQVPCGCHLRELPQKTVDRFAHAVLVRYVK
jgi:hypothetical protein